MGKCLHKTPDFRTVPGELSLCDEPICFRWGASTPAWSPASSMTVLNGSSRGLWTSLFEPTLLGPVVLSLSLCAPTNTQWSSFPLQRISPWTHIHILPCGRLPCAQPLLYGSRIYSGSLLQQIGHCNTLRIPRVSSAPQYVSLLTEMARVK